jgi:hypothetical protein
MTITKFNVVMNNKISIIQLGLTQPRFLIKFFGLNIQYEKRLAANSHAPPLDFIFKLSALKMIQDGSGLIF